MLTLTTRAPTGRVYHVPAPPKPTNQRRPANRATLTPGTGGDPDGDAGGVLAPVLAIAVRITLSTGQPLHLTEIEAYGLGMPATAFSYPLPECGGSTPVAVPRGIAPLTTTYENAGDAGFGRDHASWFLRECFAACTATPGCNAFGWTGGATAACAFEDAPRHGTAAAAAAQGGGYCYRRLTYPRTPTPALSESPTAGPTPAPSESPTAGPTAWPRVTVILALGLLLINP